MNMKKRFTRSEKINGEMAVSTLSEKAEAFTIETDPISVYEVENDEGEKRYYLRGYQDIDDMSLEELEEYLEAQWDCVHSD